MKDWIRKFAENAPKKSTGISPLNQSVMKKDISILLALDEEVRQKKPTVNPKLILKIVKYVYSKYINPDESVEKKKDEMLQDILTIVESVEAIVQNLKEKYPHASPDVIESFVEVFLSEYVHK
ncbi:hypothetical protein [Thermoflavimicrobium dichotomicum]|uniref:Uncharacterized protein n=1 Tax=Thermoflavimicrobium dichotomicum TaxID=46223 RepID=A0A1I3K6F4_9BACL|nr:hypothetical protein [Thermoflavimicrobium dichotomicum]SFI68026.1 hypothetical protein SAMN05421852_101350 [Thermoflavimicrobium dichotomicum]